MYMCVCLLLIKISSGVRFFKPELNKLSEAYDFSLCATEQILDERPSWLNWVTMLISILELPDSNPDGSTFYPD
jgi:hypothetical protein